MSGASWRARLILVSLLGMIPPVYALTLAEWVFAAAWIVLVVSCGAAVWRANTADEARPGAPEVRRR